MRVLASFPICTFGLMFSVAALGQSRNIHEDVDPYNHLRILMLEVTTRTCPGDPRTGYHDPIVHLLFSAFERPDHSVEYFVTPELDRGSPLNLQKKATMDTLIDGGSGYLITPMGSTVVTAYDGAGSYIHETIPFAIRLRDLQVLAGAGEFQFRINGPRQSVQRCTDAKRFRDLAEYLDASTAYGRPVNP